jgi:hypothetical protein
MLAAILTLHACTPCVFLASSCARQVRLTGMPVFLKDSTVGMEKDARTMDTIALPLYVLLAAGFMLVCLR